MRNVDTNICLRIIHNTEGVAEIARNILEAEQCRFHSAVIEEILHELYWSHYRECADLRARDALRMKSVQLVKMFYTLGYVGGDNSLIICVALDFFMYCRLDWTDSYLLARALLKHESFTTLDQRLLKLYMEAVSLGNRVPVVSSYTLSLDSLPSHMCIREKDRKSFEKLNLLATQD